MTSDAEMLVLLRMQTVMGAFGAKHAQRICEWVRNGVITKPIHLGRTATWPRHEIQAILRARIAGADDAQVRALVDSLHTSRAGLAKLSGVA